MTSQNLNSQKLSKLQLSDPVTLAKSIEQEGCSICELGTQESLIGPVFYRGNPESKLMIIGEAPGKEEDSQRKPFVGPAGQLLDKIFMSVGWNTDIDWYLTNTVKCRPISKDSYKQNRKPKDEERAACLPFLYNELSYIDPNYVVLLGKSAVSAILPSLLAKPMYKIVGNFYYRIKWPQTTFFIMYHPAAILHSSDLPEKMTELKQKTWEHIQLLYETVNQ